MADKPKEVLYEVSDTGLAVPKSLRGTLVVPDEGSRHAILNVETPAIVQEGSDNFWQDFLQASAAQDKWQRGLIPTEAEENARVRMQQNGNDATGYAAEAAKDSLKPGRLERMIQRLRMPGDEVLNRAKKDLGRGQ